MSDHPSHVDMEESELSLREDGSFQLTLVREDATRLSVDFDHGEMIALYDALGDFLQKRKEIPEVDDDDDA